MQIDLVRCQLQHIKTGSCPALQSMGLYQQGQMIQQVELANAATQPRCCLPTLRLYRPKQKLVASLLPVQHEKTALNRPGNALKASYHRIDEGHIEHTSPKL